MKTALLCLVMLALVVNATYEVTTEKYLVMKEFQNQCAPVGLVNITQDTEGHATIRGIWNPTHELCQELGWAGKHFEKNFTATRRDTYTAVEFQTNEGIEELSFNHYSFSDYLSIFVGPKGKLYTRSSISGIPIVDEELTKFKDIIGSYSFSLTAGSSDECCIPESLEVFSPERELGMFTTNGTWSSSKSCEKLGLSKKSWEKFSAGATSNSSIGWITLIGEYDKVISEISWESKNATSGLKFINPSKYLPETCQVSVIKRDPTSLIPSKSVEVSSFNFIEFIVGIFDIVRNLAPGRNLRS